MPGSSAPCRMLPGTSLRRRHGRRPPGHSWGCAGLPTNLAARRVTPHHTASGTVMYGAPVHPRHGARAFTHTGHASGFHHTEVCPHRERRPAPYPTGLVEPRANLRDCSSLAFTAPTTCLHGGCSPLTRPARTDLSDATQRLSSQRDYPTPCRSSLSDFPVHDTTTTRLSDSPS